MAKGGNGGGASKNKSAQAHAQDREAAKLRKKRNAGKGGGFGRETGGFNLRACVLQRKNREAWQAASKANGEALLGKAKIGALMLKRPVRDDVDSVESLEKAVQKWQRDVYDVINAAKASTVFYVWDRDWQDTGVFRMAPKKVHGQIVAKAAA